MCHKRRILSVLVFLILTWTAQNHSEHEDWPDRRLHLSCSENCPSLSPGSQDIRPIRHLYRYRFLLCIVVVYNYAIIFQYVFFIRSEISNWSLTSVPNSSTNVTPCSLKLNCPVCSTPAPPRSLPCFRTQSAHTFN